MIWNDAKWETTGSRESLSMIYPSKRGLGDRKTLCKTVEGSVAERFKVLTHNLEVLSLSPLPAGHACVLYIAFWPVFLPVRFLKLMIYC